jgi:hypothetical protein
MMARTLNSNGNTDGVTTKRVNRPRGEPADWKSIDSEAIRAAISALGSIGGALRFGYTRDGGAYAIGIYGLEAQPYTEYLRPGDDVQAYLYQLADNASHAGPPLK